VQPSWAFTSGSASLDGSVSFVRRSADHAEAWDWLQL